MTRDKIIRAWKDVEFRNSLTEQEKAQLPAHPAGVITLSDDDLDGVAGGLSGGTYTTYCSKGQHCINSNKGSWTC